MTPHLTRAVLALDPGGSKCDALLAGEDGTVVGWSRIQHPGVGGRSSQVIRTAITRAIGQATFDELHVAGFDNTLPAGIIGPGRIVRVRFWPLSESEGALALAGQRAGVVVVAGTGARVSAISREGRTLSLDGLGPLLGDYGSGYSIGLQALRASVLAFRHARHHTSLKYRVLNAFAGTPTGDEPVPQEERLDENRQMARAVNLSITPHDRSTVAALAKIVNEEAQAGDLTAIRILRNAAVAIGETIWDLLDTLQIAGDDYVLAGTGSVARDSDIFWGHLCSLIRGMAPRFTMVRCSGAAVLGNASYVLRELFPEAVAEINERLLETPPPVSSLLSDSL